MIVTRILPGDVAVGERQVAVGVQTGRDPQSVRRQVTFETIVTDHVEDPILGGCHVEAAVGQRPEVPVAAVVLVGHPLGDAVDDRFQLQREMNAEEFLGDEQALILRDEFTGHSCLRSHGEFLTLKRILPINSPKTRSAFRAD